MPATSTPRTPEGRLIRRHRKQKRLPIPAAARLAGISEAHWGHVERGWRTLSAGEQAEVDGTADTVALMAAAVGASPEDLDTAGRRDAAGALREMTGTQAAGTPVPSGEEEEDRAATIAAVQQLYSGDVAMNAAMLIMTQWNKPLATRRAELADMERGIRDDAAEARR